MSALNQAFRKAPLAIVTTALVLASGWSSGAGTSLALGDARLVEGNNGNSVLRFPITRTGDLSTAISVGVQTDDAPASPATAGVDYVPVPPGTRFIMPAGQSNAFFDVAIKGDTTLEPDENFLLRLSSAQQTGDLDFDAGLYFRMAPYGAEYTADPSGSATADLDGDGRPELLVFQSKALAVFPNHTSDGRLKLGAQLQFDNAEARVGSLVSGDFDGDQKPDVAMADYFGSRLILLRNTSTTAAIRFATPVVLPLGAMPGSVQAADFNGDGKLDLVTTNYWDNSISVLANTSTSGQLGFQGPQKLSTGASPHVAALRDLDGDGKTDIVVANSGEYSLTLFHNQSQGGGVMFTASSMATEGYSNYVTSGDIDGDGRAELVITPGDYNRYQVLDNQSDATGLRFTPKAAVWVLQRVDRADAQDMDGDGKADLILSSHNTATLRLSTSSGGNFDFSAPEFFYGLSTNFHFADLDGDQRLDLSAAGGNEQLIVLRNRSSPGKLHLAAAPTFGTGTEAFKLAVGDIDGDGRPDTVTGSSFYRSVAINLNRSSGGELRMEARGNIPDAGSLSTLALRDLDGDGKPDLAVTDSSSAGGLTVMRNTSTTGQPQFAAGVSFPVAPTFTGVYADFDGDGRLDAAFIDYPRNAVAVLRNRSSVGLLDFAATLSLTTGAAPSSIAAGDVDGDGKPDLVVTAANDGNITVLRNLSSTSGIAFAPRENIASPAPGNIALIDVDGDGRLDLLTSNAFDDSLTILPNQSSAGNFRFGMPVSAGRRLSGSIVGGDLDGDGHPELVVASGFFVAVLRNRSTPGQISIDPQVEYSPGQPSSAVAIADMDGDDRPDLVAGQNNQQSDGSILRGVFSPVDIATNEGLGTILDDDTDTTPDSFGFAWRFGAARATEQVSDSAAIEGINVPAPISVQDGEYSINGAAFRSTPGTIRAGDTLRLRHISATGFGDTTLTVVTVGGVSASFMSTTAPEDTTPDPLSFASRADVSPGSTVESAPADVGGIDVAVSISVNGGEYSINGGAFVTTTGTVAPGARLRLRHTAAAGYGQTTTTTINVGGVSASFASTTRAADVTPEPVTLGTRTGVPPGTLMQSAAVQVRGIDVPIPISIAGGEYSINGGAFIDTASTVAPGDTVVVRLRSMDGPRMTAVATLQIGSLSVPFSVETEEQALLDLGKKGGGAFPASLLLLLAGMAVLRRRTGRRQPG